MPSVGACLQHSQDWPMWPLVWTPTVPVILTRVLGPIPPGHWAGPTAVRQQPTSCRTPTASRDLHPPGPMRAPEATWRGVGPLWALGQEPSSPLSVASTPHLQPRAHALCGRRRPGELLLQVQSTGVNHTGPHLVSLDKTHRCSGTVTSPNTLHPQRPYFLDVKHPNRLGHRASPAGQGSP